MSPKSCMHENLVNEYLVQIIFMIIYTLRGGGGGGGGGGLHDSHSKFSCYLYCMAYTMPHMIIYTCVHILLICVVGADETAE